MIDDWIKQKRYPKFGWGWGDFGAFFGIFNGLLHLFLFDGLKREFLTVWKGKFWRFGKGNFDSLKWEILTVWKEKFWQFEKGIFDSLKWGILTVLKVAKEPISRIPASQKSSAQKVMRNKVEFQEIIVIKFNFRTMYDANERTRNEHKKIKFLNLIEKSNREIEEILFLFFWLIS